MGGADYRKSMRSLGQEDFLDINDDNYVRCEDHLNKLSEDLASERYCLRCKTAVCSSCIIDYHSSHIQDAKTKIYDFIKLQRKEVDALKPLIFTSTHKNEILDSINNYFEVQSADLTRYLDKRKREIDDMKNNLDKVYFLETRIINELKEKSEEAYNQMYNFKLHDLLEKCNIVSLEILKIVEAWDKLDMQEKMDLVKKNHINVLKQDANLKRNHLSLEVDIIKGNVINLVDYVKSFRLDITKNTLTEGIEIEINNIYATLKHSFDTLEKIDIIKFSKNPSFNNNMNRSSMPSKNKNDLNEAKFANTASNSEKLDSSGRSFTNNITKDGDERKEFEQKNVFNRAANQKPQNNITLDGDNNSNNKTNQSLANNSIISILSENDSINTAFSNAIGNSFAYEFFIGIKPGFKNIKVFDPKAQRIFNFELSRSMFNDKSVKMDDFFNNCRYVNLGFSVLITGGLANSCSVPNSYLLIVNRNQLASIGADNSIQITIIPYSSMNDARERHCMINLPNRSKVLVCSGFLKKSVEIVDMRTGTWASLGGLSEIRANATGAYINNKYAYIFGGFKLENSKGIYNNNCEVLDLNNEQSVWKLIDFENKFSNNNIKITAAGVLNYSNEKVLLCGGYNGTVYLKEVYCVEHNDNNLDVFDKTKLQLAEELIFFHSAFVKCGGSAVNFDYKMDLNVYNPLTKEFKLYK